MSIIEQLIELFEKGAKPKDLINKGIPKSTVYEAYRRYKARIEAKKKPIVEVFKRLEEGKTLAKIVVETGLDPDEVKKIYGKWLELKKIDVNQPTVPKIIEDLKKELEGIRNERSTIRIIKNILDKVYIIKCPRCWTVIIAYKTAVRIGSQLRCPNGHTFTLQQNHIIS